MNHDNDRICNDDDAHIWSIHDSVLLPTNRQSTDEENSSNNEEIFHRFGANNYWSHYDRKSRDFHMKINLPIFNGHLHVENFLSWLNKVERFFKYIEISKKMKVSFCQQLERRSFC